MNQTDATIQADTVKRRMSDGATAFISRSVGRAAGLSSDDAVLELLATVCADSHGQVLKQDERSRVTLHEALGRRWVIKHDYLWPPLMWLYHIVRRTPAWREWYGARALAEAGVRTNPPLAIVHRSAGPTARQMLVLPYVEGPSLHQHIEAISDSDGQTHEDHHRHAALARAIGVQMGRIAAAGLIYRDYKPTNLIVDRRCLDEGLEPVIIDPNGLRPRRSDRQVLRMPHVLVRAARRAGRVSMRQKLRCLRAMLAADPTILSSRRRRLKAAVELMDSMIASRPLSYDPAIHHKD